MLTLGSFVFLNQSLPLPPAFTASSGMLTLSGCEFILYMDHLEPLTESNNNQQRTPGIAKLDLLGVLFFFSLKDPLIGQNQFQTASVPPARLSRHCLPPASLREPNGLLGGNGKAGFLPSQTPHFVKVIIPAGGIILNDHCYPSFEEERKRNEVVLFSSPIRKELK